MFECDVTGVSCEAALCDCDHFLNVYSIAPRKENNIPRYNSMLLQTTFSESWFHSSFQIVFLTIAFSKISRSVLVYIIGYTLIHALTTTVVKQ